MSMNHCARVRLAPAHYYFFFPPPPPLPRLCLRCRGRQKASSEGFRRAGILQPSVTSLCQSPAPFQPILTHFDGSVQEHSSVRSTLSLSFFFFKAPSIFMRLASSYRGPDWASLMKNHFAFFISGLLTDVTANILQTIAKRKKRH